MGARLVTTLTSQGHEVVAASPRSGVDAITGEGLAEVLKGAADVAVFNVDGGFCATQARCTHKQGPLSEGTVDGSTVTCPSDTAQFNIWTGAGLRGPATEPLKTYEVIVDGDIGRIDVGPATALAAQQPASNPASQTPHQETLI